MASPSPCCSLLRSLGPEMSGLALLPALLLLAAAVPSCRAVATNSCGITAEHRCDFVCHCGDCSDENLCGFLGLSATLGSPFTCDFEDGDCGWRDVSTSAYRWVRGRGSLEAGGTGPPSDHTVGTDRGWFMVTESPPAKATVSAQLRSPLLREAAATCEVWASYHLSGSGLNETARPALSLSMAFGDNVVELWQSPERGAEGWHQLVAYPGRIVGQFQLTFTVTQPPACGTVLALDDIVFRNCGVQATAQQLCRAEEGNCSHGSCLALDRFCDGTDDCGDGSDEAAEQCQTFSFCSFEEDFCIWEVEPGQPTWERNVSMNLGTTSGIPTRDHSSNSATGHFLHITGALAAGPSSMARLSSPTFQATNSCSLVLYSHLHGSASSSLSISYVANGTQHPVRERTGDTGSCWVRERVNFSVTGSFQVLIEGVAGSGGTVAIDDLILSPGCVQQEAPWPSPGLSPSEPAPMALPGRARASPCTAEQFSCADGSCISAQLACDFAETCTDGSDETRCGATTFEDGDGGWHDTSVGRLRWGVQSGTEAVGSALAGGAFLALQKGEGQMVAPARARTPLLGPSSLACVMEMTFRLHSGPQGFLAVAVTELSTGMTHLAWHTRGHDSTAWERIRIPLGERARPFQVELLGLAELQGTQGAAIDNVTFVQCDPAVRPPGATELSCNFEADLCAWYQDRSSNFQWVRGMGQGQGSDHTTGSGHFLAADPSAPWSRGQRAQLLTYSQEPATAPRCLAFWYRLAGPQIGTLSLRLQPEGAEETLLWTQRGSQGSVWQRGLVTLPATEQRYRLAFEVLRDGFMGDAALDDVALTAGPCGAERSCSFEAGACGLEGSGQVAWLRQSNGTGTVPGPPADHSTGTAAGHYMVVSTGVHSLPTGHAAMLSSALYQRSAAAQCLSFWYQLSAGAPGSLNVLMEENGEQKRLFSVSVMEGDIWHRGHVTIQAEGDWKAVFEAVGAGGNQGYVALDDLHVSDGACPEPGSCSFEQDTCGWGSPSEERLHGFAWGWKSGAPLAKYPGPKRDHTLGTADGHYMHFDTRVLGAGGTAARLESQPLTAAADGCLHFWYHMDIPKHLSSGELRVMLRSTAGQRTAWSMAGHQSQGWVGSAVPVQSSSEFQIVFEVTTRSWPMEGTVALDDIEYSAAGGCDSIPEAPGKEKSSSSFVAEVVLGVLLALITVVLAAASGQYWLKRRKQGSGMAAESGVPQGFDNITFRDDKVIIA